MIRKENLHLILALSLFIGNSTALFSPAANAQTTVAQNAGKTSVNDANLPDLESRLAAIEKAVNERRKALGIPGVALVIVKDDRVIYMKGLGVKDFENHLPVTPDTLFAIGSSTKAFTAMLSVMSADDGKMSLDDSPKKFIPYFKLRDPDADARITIRDLLSHRSGLNRTDLAIATGKLTREEIIRIAGLAKPAARLREKFLYQNVMYTAAGEAVARANHSTWENLVVEHLFKPLGMRETVLSISNMKKSQDFSLGYEYDGETKQTKLLEMVNLNEIAPAGAINSSARDMALWLRLLLGGGIFNGKRLVSEKSFKTLFTKQINVAPGVGYGLGWFLHDWEGHQVADHGGVIDGYNAMVGLMQDQKLGFVMLSNVTSSPLESEVEEIVWSQLVGKKEAIDASATFSPIRTISDTSSNAKVVESSAVSKELEGSYENEQSGKPYQISVREDQVSFIAQNQPPRALIEKERDNFSLSGLPDNFSLLVRRDRNGSVIGVTIKQPTADVKLRRMPELPATLTVDALMAKVIQAAGGEANLRKHYATVISAIADLEHQGMTAEVTINRQAPAMMSTKSILIALGKNVGTIFEYFDGAKGGTVASFGTPESITGKELVDARVESDFHQLLDWKSLFTSIILRRMSKVGDDDVYVIVKTPDGGNPVTDYISTKTYLVLKRETLQTSSTNQIVIPLTEVYSDYRMVDGVMIPFKTVSSDIISGEVVTLVKSVRFNVKLPATAFHP